MKTIRLGVIGVGGMGQAHCKSVLKIPEVRLAAVSDADAETTIMVGKEHGVPYFPAEPGALIRSGLCDAVLVATPHPIRPPIVLAAMQAGLHVLSEKPLAEAVSAADKMIKTAKQTGVAFGVMFQRRTEPALAQAIRIARSGQLGKIQRTAMISPEYRSQAYYDSAGWRATWKGEGGGVMMNQAPHIMDLFILLGGMPSQVFGRTETRLHRIEVEDLAEALLTYPDGGTGYFYCSTNEPAPGQMIEVFGDKGKLCYRDGKLTLTTYEPPVEEFTRTNTQMWAFPKAVEQPLPIDETESGHAVIIQNFARHILFKEPLIAPGEEGLRPLELANAIWLSAALKKPVKLPISRKAYDAFLAAKRKAASARKKIVVTQRTTDPRHTT
jgi:predicted dehydrogenase